MSVSVKVIGALVGPSHELVESDISNWDDVIDLITTTPCDFEIHYNDSIITGSIAKSVDELTLLVGFDDSNIALPGGMCLIVNCAGVQPNDHECFPDVQQSINVQSRLLFLDQNNCPVGYITLQQVINLVEAQLNIPQTLCDLITDGIPEGNLVASDRIVTTTGDPACTLKSVPQSQVVCD